MKTIPMPHLAPGFRAGSLAGAAFLALAGAVSAGCSSSNVGYASISNNLTPELQGTVERPIDVNRNMAVTFDQNWRSASDDLGRILYTNHPSRLSPYPIVSSSGVPR